MISPQPEDQDSLNQDEALIYDWRIHSIRQALKQKGKATGPLEIQDLLELGHLDQYHYFGAQACDRAIEHLGLHSKSKVLDIGSGVGGPARYISHKTNCNFHCVELRSDFNEIAQELTERLGLQDRIQYLTGSIISDQVIQALSSHSFDNIISFLTLLHIAERDQVLDVCFDALTENGCVYIEDYVANTTLTSETENTLKDVLQAPYIPTRDAYRHHFEDAGFTDIGFIDLTTGWKPWVAQRYNKFTESKAEAINLFGEAVYEHRSQFYQTVKELFKNGQIGGTLITAKKPPGPKIIPLPDANRSLRTPVYSEQYHFFLENGALLSLRYFRSGTLEHCSAWWGDTQGTSQELINISEHAAGDSANSNRFSHLLSIQKNDKAGTITLPEAHIKLEFEVATAITWAVPGEENHQAVIHQPQLLATISVQEGGTPQTHKAVGYCKIYQGNYPKFWGYHFVHAFFPNFGIIWTADATFGQEKYNYFKLLSLKDATDSSTVLDGDTLSYHRTTTAHTQIQNQEYELNFDAAPFATWSARKSYQPATLGSRLCLDYRPALLKIDGQDVAQGVCLKESCFGTIS